MQGQCKRAERELALNFPSAACSMQNYTNSVKRQRKMSFYIDVLSPFYHCFSKRWPFAFQKVISCRLKGRLLQPERRPFARALSINGLRGVGKRPSNRQFYAFRLWL
jgi:hypothetical protein